MANYKFSEFISSVNMKAIAIYEKPLIPFIFLLCVVLLAYGYEIFGFHLTIDEELHTDYAGIITAWGNQGRWGMSILSIFIPSTVVPVVSPMLGISLTAFAWWFILTKAFDLGRFEASLAVAIAVTIPVLTFSITFSTLAYGIGVGNLCVAVFAYQLVKGNAQWLAIGAVAGAFAVSIYQTFIFSILAICLFAVYREGSISWSRIGKRVVLIVFGTLVIYASVDWLVRFMLGSDLVYVGGFLDIKGFLSDPLGRFSRAANNVTQVLELSVSKFGIHSPWLEISLLLAVSGCLFGAIADSWRISLIRCGSLCGVVLLPIMADAIATGGAPLRSGVYYSALAGLLIGFGFIPTGRILRITLLCSIGAAIVGNAVIDNRLFSASEIAYQFDRNLANEVLLEVNKLPPLIDDVKSLKIDVVGSKGWPENRLMPKRETFGASFFEWDGGNRYRVAAFLRLSGLNVVAATADESAMVTQTAINMPAWPNHGWVVIDQGVLILKFGNYSLSQELALCRAGVASMCH